VRDGTYDVIVLDAPPTADTLRFVNIYATLEWYVRRRFHLDGHFARIAGPLVQRLADVPLPNGGFHASVQQLFQDLEHVDALLTDPDVTTVRLVTNAEKMVIRETQRAYMYFCLYGITTDHVVINRLLRDTDGYYARWVEAQAAYVEQISDYFRPVPVSRLPLFAEEVAGIASLGEVAAALYQGRDPTTTTVAAPGYEFHKERAGYALRISLPFVAREALDITRVAEDVVVRVGNFKRHIPVPRPLRHLRTNTAQVDGSELLIRFSK
jgi:arsenite/tail-anchored protein-transporting ATPase